MTKRRPEGLTATLLIGPATMVVLLSLVLPLALLARYSLNRYDRRTFMVEAFTPENYLRFITDPFYTGVLWTTFSIAVVTTLLCLVLGFPVAYKLARSQSRWKSIGVLLVILPLFIGSTVRALGWMGMLGRGGIVDAIYGALGGSGISLLNTSFAVALGILSINLPYMILTLQSVVEGIDENLEQAAESLGAAPARAFWRIVWPMALPGTMIAAVLCFILAMNAFATPVLIGGPRFHMMAPLLYWEFTANNNWPFASALALILMTTTLVMTVLANKLILGRQARA